MVFEHLAQKAFSEIFITSVSDFTFQIKFSAKFRDYNANIKYHPHHKEVIFALSSEWKEVDEDIIIGLMQHLLIKLFSKKYKLKTDSTLQLKFYEGFLNNLGKYVTTTNIDEVLADSFLRMNELYFDGLLDRPNLIWGSMNKRKMGHYDYQNDTIMISETLRERMDLVDFVMFHEMLHKKHKFYTTQTGRRMHHHTAFRNEEKQYPGFASLEKELSLHVVKTYKKKPTPVSRKPKTLTRKWFDLLS